MAKTGGARKEKRQHNKDLRRKKKEFRKEGKQFVESGAGVVPDEFYDKLRAK